MITLTANLNFWECLTLAVLAVFASFIARSH